MINFIVAIDDKLGLADEKGIPWKIKKDVEYFRENTLNGIVVMGYRTYEEFDKPLPDRLNYVLVRDNTELRPGFLAISDLDKFINDFKEKEIWIIGGAGLFAKTISLAEKLYLTRIRGDFNCTKFFPPFEASFYLDTQSKLTHENGFDFFFEVWRRK